MQSDAPDRWSGAEAKFLEGVALEETPGLLERFSTLVRESGTPDEFAAADYIQGRLASLEIPHTVHQPDLYISIPREASLEARSDGKKWTIRAKTPAFSLTTSAPVEAPLVYLPSQKTRDMADLFENHLPSASQDVAGKVVMTEGYSMPKTVRALEKMGAVGLIFIHPGEPIHEMICTTIWGNPTHQSLARKPGLPVININHPDGQRLIASTRQDLTSVSLETRVEERWRPCAVVEAVIQGGEWAEEFILLHGHYDSWHFGIGDNATGNAGLLELARIFHSRSDNLRRTIKILWWPGHSTGRYAGSTWYADQFALQLRNHCVAQVNMDSPGCVGATSYEEVMWMAECDSICRSAIEDRTAAPIQRLRPLRAGDYSFNQIGISSFFMLSSNRPPEQRKQMGLYPVGGCGGNTVWHTEDDLMAVYDPEIMLQDLRVYVAALTRTANAEVLPFDHRAAVEEMKEGLTNYEVATDGRLDLNPVREALVQLDASLSRFYQAVESGSVSSTRANHLLKRIGRKLIPLNYSLGESFDHDPAEPLGVLPKLADVGLLKQRAPGSAEEKFLLTGLVRQRNKVVNQLRETVEMIEDVVG